MPIIVPESSQPDPLFDRLASEGAALISANAAESQDIRPARIGLLNLMPAQAMETTEAQWLRYMSRTVLQIEPVLIKFDNDRREREGRSRSSILPRYEAFSVVADKGLDGLIVTGDNLEVDRQPDGSVEPIEFSDIKYGPKLVEVIKWARSNVQSTVYSCLAGHFALNHLYDLPREIKEEKVFGVYDHEVVDSDSSFVQGMDDVIRSPHSRWGNISPDRIGDAALKLLAVNEEIGWLLVEDDNEAGGKDLFIQGHPEYDKTDLDKEYSRDKVNGQTEPVGYYNKDQTPQLTWANDARALHSNWISVIYDHFSTQIG